MKQKKILSFSIYTIAFFLTAFLVFYSFIKNGESLIARLDATSQHYTTLYYFSELLRGAIAHPSLNNPMWSWNIGYGADILTTLSYYVIGDPISLLVVFFSPDKTEIAYILLIILRFYLAGITFMIFCRYMKMRFMPTLIGSLMYAFMGYMVYAMIHPYFLNPVIYLPLLTLGIEKIYKKEKPFLFIVMIFVSAVSNYYFFYMLSIVIFLYAAVRFFYFNKENIIKNLFGYLFKFVFFYLLGVLMAAAILFPSIMALLGGARTIKEMYPVFLFPASYYKSAILGFSSVVSIGYWAKMSYAFVAFLFIPLFILRWKKSRTFSNLFIILTIMTLLPIFGYLLNGFAYISDRWMFSYGFIVCFLTVMILSDKLKFSRIEKIAMYLMMGLFIVMLISTHLLSNSIILTLCIGLATLLLLTFGQDLSDFFSKYARSGIALKVSKNAFEILLLVIVIVNLGMVDNYTDKSEKLYTNKPIKYGTIYNKYKTQGTILNKIKDTDFFRVDKTYSIEGSNISDYNSNDSIIQNYNGTQAFFSMLPKSLYDRYSELDLRTLRYEALYGDNDNRTALEALTSVRYLAIKTGDEGYVPYGFSKIAASGKYKLYKNNYSLPIGFVYDKYLTHSEFLKYSPIKRQQILLQGVVLDQLPVNQINGVSKLTPENNFSKLNYKIKTNNILIKSNSIEVLKDEGTITLRTGVTRNSELYAEFRNIQINASSNRAFTLQYKCGNVAKDEYTDDPTSQYYVNNVNQLVNLGYRGVQNKNITISFSKKGNYTYDSLNLYSVPMSSYTTQIEKLSRDGLKNVTYSNNYVKGNITLNKPGILYMSIPYSKGWKAYVNGVNVQVLPADTMFCAIPLQAGRNNIEFRYSTPGLMKCISISVIAFVIFLLLIMLYRGKANFKTPLDS